MNYFNLRVMDIIPAFIKCVPGWVMEDDKPRCGLAPANPRERLGSRMTVAFFALSGPPVLVEGRASGTSPPFQRMERA
jgi:hypothetical protein